jgi:hypothetical protein
MRWLTLLLDYVVGQGPLRFRLESLYEHTFSCYFCSEVLLLLDRYIPSAFFISAEGRLHQLRAQTLRCIRSNLSHRITHVAISLVASWWSEATNYAVAMV